MNSALLIVNISYGVALFINVCALIFVLIKSRDALQKGLFSLTNISLSIFLISHIVGTSVTDQLLSQKILFFNMINICIVAFNLHWVAAMLGITKKKKVTLTIVYVVGAVLLGYFIVYPETFLLPSLAKLYFPNYYVPGSLYTLMRIYFGVVAIWILFWIIQAFGSANPVERNRLRYLFYTHILAYAFGSMALFLVYDIPVDPIWSAWIGLYTVPLGYAMVRYRLMDIRTVAWRALFAFLSVIGITGLLFLNNILEVWIGVHFKSISPFVLPFVTAVLAVIAGSIVWRFVRRSDRIEGELIGLVTEKIKKPLLNITKATDILLASEVVSQSNKEAVQQIKDAEEKLDSLMNLVGSIETENAYFYTFKELELREVLLPIIYAFKRKGNTKGVSVILFDEVKAGKDTVVSVDEIQIVRALEVVFTNAYTYTKEHGSIKVQIVPKRHHVEIYIVDSGIGIPRGTLSFVGSPFFRAQNAKEHRVDGLGVDLYNAKTIVKNHGGRLLIESAGADRGTTVVISLPRIR